MIRTLIFSSKDIEKCKKDVEEIGGKVVNTEINEIFEESFVRIEVKEMQEFWNIVELLKYTESGKICNNRCY